MSVYYVSTTGNNENTGLGIGNAEAWATLTKAMQTVEAGDIVKILPGTYEQSCTTSTAGNSDNWIVFEAKDYNNKPLINGSGVDRFAVNHEYYEFKGLKVTGGGRAFDIETDNVLVEQCEIYETGTSGIRIRSADASNVTIQRNKISDTANRQIDCETGGVKLYYNTIQGFKSGSALNTIQVYVRGSGTSYIYNNTIIGAYSYAMLISGGDVTATVKNNIIAHYGVGNNLAYGLEVASGATVNYDYNLITPNMQRYNRTVNNGTDGGHNLVGSQYLPGFTAYRNVGKVLLTLDDTLDEFEEAAAIAHGDGLDMTGNIYWVDNSDEENLATRINALIADGHDIGNHTRSHADLGATYNGTLQYDGADSNPVINIDHTTNTITLSTTEGNDDVTISDTDTKTIEDLETAVSGENWSYTKLANQQSETFLTSLADTDGDDALVGSPPVLQLSYNMSDFHDNEIDWTKTWIDGVATGDWEQKAISYPYWTNNSTIIDSAIGAGLLLGRESGARGFDLRNLYIYEFSNSSWVGLKSNGSETEMKRMYNQFVRGLACGPYAMAITIHTVNTDPTSAQWGYITEVLANASDYVDVVTMGALGEDVHNSGDWTDADSDKKRWTRTYEDNSNYTLKKTSSCIGAGVAVGLTLDYAGNPVPEANPDIGAYQSVSNAMSSGLHMGIGISL